MPKVHFIAMDTHCQKTFLCIKNRHDGLGREVSVPTTIPALRAVIESVPRPRKLTFEEGPLADWLWRNLQTVVDEAVVCDPRRNALVAKDGDKDDPIDARKLCELQMNGQLRKVHHPASVRRQLDKQTVGLYHRKVRARVGLANELMGYLRRWGVMVREKDFRAPDEASREAALRQLEQALEHPQDQAQVRGHAGLMLADYDHARQQEELLGRQIKRLAQADEQAVRWQEVPGIGPVRALTLLVYLDTPWRFKRKQALWKYLGIGLVREHSGNGYAYVHVEQRVNRALKNAILGAAKHVCERKIVPFYGRYQALVEAGVTARNARRTVARMLAEIVWGMWKTGSTYSPEQAARRGAAAG